MELNLRNVFVDQVQVELPEAFFPAFLYLKIPIKPIGMTKKAVGLITFYTRCPSPFLALYNKIFGVIAFLK